MRIIEIASIGPGPFAAMLLADMGAEVLCIERPAAGALRLGARDVLARGRTRVRVDLKHPLGAALVLDLCAQSDAVLEGFRPGVMERLGLGPDACLARNGRLVYGRMTGWGQQGPLASSAGHDIDYIALTGALHAIGRAGDKPVPPLNLVGDFGGGGMLLAFGVVCALWEARNSGAGQVVDAAMVDGASLLMSMFHGLRAAGLHEPVRGSNLLDGGAPFYDTYETADHRYVAVGALEPAFYAELLRGVGLDPSTVPAQMDRQHWPAMKARLAEIFRSKTRAEWCDLLENSDACFAPVLSLDEAPEHPHSRARQAFIELDGLTQPAPAPRFSRTQPEVRRQLLEAAAALRELGVGDERISELQAAGVLT
jgi:alpha-methylacyl-CoA racemase